MTNLLNNPAYFSAFVIIIFGLIEIIKFILGKVLPKKQGLTQEEHDWLRDVHKVSDPQKTMEVLANIVMTQKEILIILKSIKEKL